MTQGERPGPDTAQMIQNASLRRQRHTRVPGFAFGPAAQRRRGARMLQCASLGVTSPMDKTDDMKDKKARGPEQEGER
jgi:hypothetical protein